MANTESVATAEHHISHTIDALAGLAWPLIVGFLAWKLFPFVRTIFESRAFSIKVAGMEISVQDATEQLRTQIEDLQHQVLALRSGAGVDGGQGPEARSALESAGPVAAPEPAPAVPASGPVLWVDDKPTANAYEIAQLQAMGVPVIKAATTAAAMEMLEQHPTVRAIISDMGRAENGGYQGRAGLDLLSQVRHAGHNVPFVIYTTAKYAQRRGAEVVEQGGDGAISSQVELLEWLKRKVGAQRT